MPTQIHQIPVSPEEHVSEPSRFDDLAGRLARVLASERGHTANLSRVELALADAAEDLRKELERMAAAERRVEKKRRRVNELLEELETVEAERLTARKARSAIESLKAQLGSHPARATPRAEVESPAVVRISRA